MSNVIKVPKPSLAAYNPGRELDKNALVRAQVAHFREAEQGLPEDLRTGLDAAAIRTEGEASEYIGKVTRAIHENSRRAPAKVRTAR
jgi:hypothetical protein